jgi:hypothetical protein
MCQLPDLLLDEQRTDCNQSNALSTSVDDDLQVHRAPIISQLARPAGQLCNTECRPRFRPSPGTTTTYWTDPGNSEDDAGCAMIISHDRWFLDRIATHILAFEGDSHVEWFEGSFTN